jgi:hypothetical protein
LRVIVGEVLDVLPEGMDDVIRPEVVFDLVRKELDECTSELCFFFAKWPRLADDEVDCQRGISGVLVHLDVLVLKRLKSQNFVYFRRLLVQEAF